MRRGHGPLVCALTAALAAACGGVPAPPSVVLVVIDTLRRDHLSLYGYEKPTSPGLDRLAREAVVFERCLATSSWTKPSVASLFSGLYPSAHGAFGRYKAPGRIRFLAEVLAEHGYATVGFSSNPFVSSIFGMDQGFQEFVFDGGDEPQDYVDARDLLAAARAWLDARRREPFFLYLHLMNVHGPYRAPPEYRERYLELPFEDLGFHGQAWKDVRRQRRQGQRPQLSRAQLNDLTARYDGAVAYTEELLAEFFEHLRERGLLANLILIVTSDHGEEFFEHGDLGHRRTLYGEVLEVPLLMRLPGGRGGGRRPRTAVSLIDVPVTVLDLAGLLEAQPEGRFGDGVSLVPLIAAADGDREGGERPLLAELMGPPGGRGALVQLWPYRLAEIVHVDADAAVVELYDVARDPRETSNLAPQQGTRVRALTAMRKTLERPVDPDGPPGEGIDPDGELEARLRALGYFEEP